MSRSSTTHTLSNVADAAAPVADGLRNAEMPYRIVLQRRVLSEGRLYGKPQPRHTCPPPGPLRTGRPRTAFACPMSIPLLVSLTCPALPIAMPLLVAVKCLACKGACREVGCYPRVTWATWPQQHACRTGGMPSLANTPERFF